MKRFSLSAIAAALGTLGAAGLLFAAFQFVRQGQFDRISQIAAAAGAVLLLVPLVVHRRRVVESLSTRSVRYGSSSALGVVVFLAILVFVGLLTSRHHQRFDLTKTGRYTLSSQTEKILKSLSQEVVIHGFFSSAAESEGQRQEAEDLFQQYRYHSPRFRYEFIDPRKDPVRARSFEITTDGTSVLVSGTKKELLFSSDLNEEKLTNAIIKVTRSGQKVVYFVSGHGEHGLDDAQERGLSELKRVLEKLNLKVEPLELARSGKVPGDASIVVLAGPTHDPYAPELSALLDYLKRGGKLFALLEPFQTPQLVGFLTRFGFKIGEDMVIDVNPVGRLFGGGLSTPLVTDYGPHEITKELGRTMSMFPTVRSVEPNLDPGQGLVAVSLVKTSRDSWAETDRSRLEGEGVVELNEGQDRVGPVSLAAAATAEVDKIQDWTVEGNGAPPAAVGPELKVAEAEPGAADDDTLPAPELPPDDKARVVVFGDSDIATNQWLGKSANGDLVFNTITWLANEKDLVAVRPKDPNSAPILMTLAQSRTLFYGMVVVVPLLVAAIGIAVYIRRRKL